MYTIDESRAPLITLEFLGAMDAATTQRLFDTLTEVLGRSSGRFAVMMTNNQGEHKHERGVARIQQDWAKANRQRLSQDCVGMALVTQSSKYMRMFGPVVNQVISRMYGCPGKVFSDPNEAEAWLRERLASVEKA